MGGERHHFCTEVFPFAVGFGWRSQFSKSNARGLRSSCCYKCDEWQVDPLGIGKGRSITFGSAEKLGIATRVSTVSLGEFPWWVDGSSKEFKNRRCFFFSERVKSQRFDSLCFHPFSPYKWWYMGSLFGIPSQSSVAPLLRVYWSLLFIRYMALIRTTRSGFFQFNIALRLCWFLVA